MRRHHALWAVAGAAGLLTSAIAPAAAGFGSQVTAPESTPVRSGAGTGATSTQTVTLITGDTVSLSAGPDGKYAVDVQRGKGREAATFLSSEKDGEVSVLPADAIPLVQAGRLDPALFNVTQLVKQGYADSKTGTTPVIATYTKGSATPDGARRILKLPTIDGVSLSAEKSTAFWTDIAPALGTEPTTKAARQLGEGIDKIWLDGKVEAPAWRIRRSCPAPSGWSNSASRPGCCRPCLSSCWWSTDAGRCCR